MTILNDFSNELAGVVSAAGGAIVRVEARRHTPASGIVWSTDGLILTAEHAVRRDEGITVGLADGRTADAALVGRDPTTDLALLRVEGLSGVSPLEHAAEADMGVGHFLLPHHVARQGRQQIFVSGDGPAAQGHNRVAQR